VRSDPDPGDYAGNYEPQSFGSPTADANDRLVIAVTHCSYAVEHTEPS
jgi:hypothetical protein